MDNHSRLDYEQTRIIGLESVGKRIAQLRSQAGLTQQALADRIAISRVAISHIEMDLSLPSERTVTLLAGIFKLSPHELIAETLYPKAKSERLPDTACCFTKLELDLALLENDLEWLECVQTPTRVQHLCEDLTRRWTDRLDHLMDNCYDEGERSKIVSARKNLNLLLDSLRLKPAEKR